MAAPYDRLSDMISRVHMRAFGEYLSYTFKPAGSQEGFRVSGIFEEAHRTEPYGSGVVVHDGQNPADITRPVVFLRKSEFLERYMADTGDTIIINSKEWEIVERIDDGRSEILCILKEGKSARASKFARHSN